jgi:hypothetical protein
MMVSDAASGNGNFVMVTNAGNVGIGSTTPSQLLDVNGDMRIGLGTFNNNVVNSTDLFVSGNLEVDGIMYGNGSGLTNLPAGTVLTDADNDTKVQVEKSFDEDYIRFDTAFVERMNINPSGNVGIGTTLPNAGVDIKATFAFEPSAATDITVGGGITVTRGVMRIAGSAGAVDITVDPQIVAGIADGQLVVLQGTSNTNTVKLDNGTGLKLSGAVSFTMGNGDMMSLMYDQGNAVWVEISRTDN